MKMNSDRLPVFPSKPASAVCLCAVLCACSAAPEKPRFTGDTNADQQLIADTREQIEKKIARYGCKEGIETITASVVVPYNGPPERRQSKERWRVTACEQRYAYVITFEANSSGNTRFSIWRED